VSELIAVGSVRIEDGPPTGVANYAGCASRSEFAGTAAYGYCASKSRYVRKMPLVLATDAGSLLVADKGPWVLVIESPIIRD
jgi:hypothetical protein